jgi:SAM-dependent methyltransferase
MPTPQDHYRNLLAHHYSWMFGLSFDEKVAEQRAILEPILKEAPRGLAIDLGSGPGFQSLALAQLGFSPVLAIDTSAELLSELEAALRAHDHPKVETHNADMLSLADYARPASASVIVCMGDTLTHLPSPDDVRRLFSAIAATLAPGGLLILTWRDLTADLTGADRFIPVHADDNRIMTCFLESTNPAVVQVHDLVYTRDASHKTWVLEKSSYPKLRLSPTWVAQALAATGLEPLSPGDAGRLSLIAAKHTAKHAANLKPGR